MKAMMVDTNEIRAYLEWRDNRVGQSADASPERYAYDMAVYDLIAEIRDHITTYPEHTRRLAEFLDNYDKALEAM